MNVVTIPTNMPVQRIDEDDEFYKNQDDKFARDRQARSARSRKAASRCWSAPSRSRSRSCCPNISTSEGVKHEVLNARYHEQEAHIVAQAGRLGAVTIATNMAGRGTDIQLGGNVEFRIEDELSDDAGRPRARRRDRADQARRSPRRRQRVIAAGGLFVLGTERHESRRIDNQLRGRSGRQGDPGLQPLLSVSLDDDLLRIFGPQTMFARMMNKNLADGEAIISPVDLQGDRDRAEEGRGAQLRHPQAGRRI